MSAYAKLTVADLKVLLKARGESVSGKKADLIARLDCESSSSSDSSSSSESSSEEVAEGASDFSGMVFAISGTLSMKRADVVDLIEKGGGDYSKSVTKRVTHLIVADPSAGTAKINKARSEGKTIIGEDFLSGGATEEAPVPQKRAKAKAAKTAPTKSAAAGNSLSGMVFAISGTLSSPRAEIIAMIGAEGGSYSTSVTKRVTHVLVADPSATTQKIAKARADGKTIVSEDFLSGGSATAAVEKPAPKKKKATLKRARAVVEEEGDDDEEEADEGVAPPSKKQKVTIKPDELAPNGVVFENWAAKLNQTNAQNNNNKFYTIQLLKVGSSYHTFTRWGRVGERGQSNSKPFGNLDGAKKLFKSKFRAKTRNDWDTVRDDYTAFKFVPGQYDLLEMDYGDSVDEDAMEEALASLTPTSRPAVSRNVMKCTLDSPLQKVMSLIFDNDMFKAQMSDTFNLDVKKMPLGKLTQTQIQKGVDILTSLRAALADSKTAEARHLSNRFFSTIPHNFGRKVPPVLTHAEEIQNKFDMCQVLSDIAVAQTLKKKSAKTTSDLSATEVTVPHPIDVSYKSLKCKLDTLPKSDEMYEVIESYTKNTMGYRKTQLLNVYEVDREASSTRFSAHDSLENRKLLWHGTNVAVVAAILSGGLRIMPHSGGRVGKGLYFASEQGKSAGYVGATGKGIGFMFLCEVALGKSKIITQDDSSLRKPPTGFDSVLAKGWTEPDSKSDVQLEFDGHDVTVPRGVPKKIPSYSQSRFSQSEYLVYREDQVKIRYLLECKFSY